MRTPRLALLASLGVVACLTRHRQEASVRLDGPVCDTVSAVLVGPRPIVPAAPPPSPDSAALVGTVRDRQTGVAIVGAAVLLLGAVRRDVVTDSAGGFVLTGLATGPSHLFVRRIGYDRYADSLRLAPGRVDTLRVDLLYRACRLRG